MHCIGCGCSDELPLVRRSPPSGEGGCLGGCVWISHDPPLCSQCAELVDDGAGESAGALAVASSSALTSAGRCPASAVPAPHAPIWIDDVSGYCARCRQGFVATEAA